MRPREDTQLVRFPLARERSTATTGAWRFAIVRSDSVNASGSSQTTLTGSLPTSVQVDVYGSTTASLAEAASKEDAEAFTNGGAVHFRGELAAVRRLSDGTWQIAKLTRTSLVNSVEEGSGVLIRFVRGNSTNNSGLTLFDEAADLAIVWAAGLSAGQIRVSAENAVEHPSFTTYSGWLRDLKITFTGVNNVPTYTDDIFPYYDPSVTPSTVSVIGGSTLMTQAAGSFHVPPQGVSTNLYGSAP